jgi:hypothetical protein
MKQKLGRGTAKSRALSLMRLPARERSAVSGRETQEVKDEKILARVQMAALCRLV